MPFWMTIFLVFGLGEAVHALRPPIDGARIDAHMGNQ